MLLRKPPWARSRVGLRLAAIIGRIRDSGRRWCSRPQFRDTREVADVKLGARENPMETWQAWVPLSRLVRLAKNLASLRSPSRTIAAQGILAGLSPRTAALLPGVSTGYHRVPEATGQEQIPRQGVTNVLRAAKTTKLPDAAPGSESVKAGLRTQNGPITSAPCAFRQKTMD